MDPFQHIVIEVGQDAATNGNTSAEACCFLSSHCFPFNLLVTSPNFQTIQVLVLSVVKSKRLYSRWRNSCAVQVEAPQEVASKADVDMAGDPKLSSAMVDSFLCSAGFCKFFGSSVSVVLCQKTILRWFETTWEARGLCCQLLYTVSGGPFSTYCNWGGTRCCHQWKHFGRGLLLPVFPLFSL